MNGFELHRMRLVRVADEPNSTGDGSAEGDEFPMIIVYVGVGVVVAIAFCVGLWCLYIKNRRAREARDRSEKDNTVVYKGSEKQMDL